jgi:hypothetical protein
MERTTLERFFTGKRFQVPPYQRDYAWEPENVDDLWNDVQEVLSLSVSHYLGTFILAKPEQGVAYDVVDGQQRLITLTMLLSALIHRLPESALKRIVAEERYIRDTDGNNRLSLLGTNDRFFRDLLAGGTPRTQTRGQKRLTMAYRRLNERADQLGTSGAAQLEQWIEGIGKLQVLEFVEEDQGNAIRIFETVNDRGVPLATIDKIKSFLIYTSNRYLNGALDKALQERFGRIFKAFDQVKEVGGDGVGVDLIKPDRFTEDNIVRYHFLSYPSTYYDYKFTAEDVLALFLKPAVKKYATISLTGLQTFVNRYSSDLVQFFEGLASIVRRANIEPDYYKVFGFLGLSASLYPLAIRLAARNLLDTPLAVGSQRTFLDAVATADLRIYKPRSRHPEKEIAELARDAANLAAGEIASRLKVFVKRWRGDDEFRSELSGSVYEQNEGVAYILLEYDEELRKLTLGRKATVDELKDFRAKEPTIDHILAQSPTFSFPGRGFGTNEDYEQQEHQLGNLALVEKRINSAARDKTPEQKASVDGLYKSSVYVSTRQFAAGLSNQAGSQIDSSAIDRRTTELRDFCLGRWSIWL